MSEYATIRKTRNKTNSILHIFLNILLALGSVFATVLSGSPIIGIILVVASKWRVFAVRPRYIWQNVKSNLVDFIVGISLVMLTYYVGSNSIAADIILAAIYTVWLLFIKPQTSEGSPLVQSLFAVFFGSTMISILSSTLNSIVIVILAFIIGYASSRHVLSQSDESNYSLIAFVCGLVFAEIAWLCHSWMIIYSFDVIGLNVSQFAIIMTIATFVFARIHQSIMKYDGKLRMSDVFVPILFGIFVIGAIVICFSSPIFNI